MQRHVHEVIAAIAPNDSKERFGGLGVRVIEGTARFKDQRTVAVGDEIEIRARRFVIATGSSPAMPPIPGLAETPLPHQRDGVRSHHAARASDRDRRRADRARAGAGVPPARRRGDGAGSRAAAGARGPRMRRDRAR